LLAFTPEFALFYSPSFLDSLRDVARAPVGSGKPDVLGSYGEEKGIA
jgi:hypothetical protein